MLLHLILRAFIKVRKEITRFLIGRIRNQNYSSFLLELVIDKIEQQKQIAITTHERLLNADAIHTFSDEVKETALIAIVIQGAIVKRNDFTLNTVKLYKKHFSNAIIIVTTWEDEAAADLKKIALAGAEIVVSTKPTFSGFNNINYQIITTAAGVNHAIAKGCTYIYKTRADQRMYAPNINEYLVALLQKFSVKDNTLQLGRLIALSLNTFKYRVYGISDMFMFGYASDMEKYWNCELDTRNLTITDFYGMSTFDFAKNRTCEVYLFTNYLNKLGIAYDWTLENSFQLIADYFIVIDKESVDLFWPKYTRKEYRWISYDSVKMHQEINFREWFILYSALSNKLINESQRAGKFFDTVNN